MAKKKTLLLRRGKTHLAYITDEEEGLLRRLDAAKGSPEAKFSPEGIPILEGGGRDGDEQDAESERRKRKERTK